MNRFTHWSLGLSLLASAFLFAGCGDDGAGGLPIPLGEDGGLPGFEPPELPEVPGVVEEAARACGIDVSCEGGGVAEGNASISGVASVDAFFQSVVNFQTKADNVHAGIQAELAAIAGDFGIDASGDIGAALEAKLEANLEGELRIQAEPARCQVDAQAMLDAQARCDAEFTPGSAMVRCEGSCEVEASANVECSADAELKCTINPPMGMCEGSCQGSCEVMLEAAARCDGTCRGTCDGECSAYSDAEATQCAGSCDGMCEGSCETQLAGEATCEGSCRGECTFTPPDGNCEGAIRAECEAMAGAMVECNGRCDGNFEPPSASAECDASVKAEASLNVECTPPRVAIDYKLKASLDAGARAEFEGAMRNLEVRLPALLAQLKRARLVVDAGAELAGAAAGAVSGSLETAATAAGDGNLRVYFGLRCAVAELGAVSDALDGSRSRLQGSVGAAAEVSSALGLEG